MANNRIIFLFLLVLILALNSILTISVSIALSNQLNTYQGTGFNDAGKESVDSFTITKGDFYCYHRITKSTRWNTGTFAEMKLTPLKKEWWGYNAINSKSQTIRVDPNNTSYHILSFIEIPDGTYEIYFQSVYKDNVDFDGIVYGDK